jgi:hypothetical protein
MKVLAWLTAIVFIAFGCMAPVVSADAGHMGRMSGSEQHMQKSQMQESMEKAHNISQYVGRSVKNPQGEDLGTVKDLVRDPEGNMSFAVLSGVEGEKQIAVPFGALSFDHQKGHFVLDTSKERFAGAPEFQNTDELADRDFAEEVYRYFGQTPYWEEGAAGDGGMGRETPHMGAPASPMERSTVEPHEKPPLRPLEKSIR